MKKFFLILLLINISSCKWFTGSGTPYYSGFSFKIPEGTPSFKKGYADGCAMILSSRGNSMMRQRYGGFHYDPDMIGNPEYRFGYSRGTSWCFQTTIGPHPVASPDRFLAYYGNASNTFEMGASNIGNAWGGLFGGSEGKAMGETIGGSVDGVVGSVTFGSGVFSGNPLWAGGSSGQFFGQ
jgi:hypothetical protein